MSACGWPPPVSDDAPWERRRLMVAGTGRSHAEVVSVRSVVLWGRTVMLDEHDRVYCPDCFRFVPADELGRLDNTHSVGLLRLRSGALIPARDEDPSARRDRSIADMEF